VISDITRYNPGCLDLFSRSYRYQLSTLRSGTQASFCSAEARLAILGAEMRGHPNRDIRVQEDRPRFGMSVGYHVFSLRSLRSSVGTPHYVLVGGCCFREWRFWDTGMAFKRRNSHSVPLYRRKLGRCSPRFTRDCPSNSERGFSSDVRRLRKASTNSKPQEPLNCFAMASQPKYLSGDQYAIDEFINKFDVR
jgi:hypothetical protein